MTEDTEQHETAAGMKSRGQRLLRRQSVVQAAVFLSIVTLLSKFIGFAQDAALPAGTSAPHPRQLPRGVGW